MLGPLKSIEARVLPRHRYKAHGGHVEVDKKTTPVDLEAVEFKEMRINRLERMSAGLERAGTSTSLAPSKSSCLVECLGPRPARIERRHRTGASDLHCK